jgi:DNA invertase Pin-like site-specific DNA recombinase
MIIYIFGYCRKSPDDKNKTQISIANQVSLIETTCKEREWKLVEIYIDNNLSGGDRNRKEFTRLIKDVILFKKEHSEDEVYILVKEQDRFARDSAFFSDTLRDLDVRFIKVFSIIKNNFISYEDLGDVVKSVVDADYIYSQRRKSIVLFKQKQERGLPPIKAPFGYKNIKKTWVIDNKKAKIVQIVCSDYTNSINFKETIAKCKIDKNNYYRIIKSCRKGLYNGFIVYVNKIRDSNKIIVREEEVKYKGLHEPIISEELFKKIQEKNE